MILINSSLHKFPSIHMQQSILGMTWSLKFKIATQFLTGFLNSNAYTSSAFFGLEFSTSREMSDFILLMPVKNKRERIKTKPIITNIMIFDVAILSLFMKANTRNETYIKIKDKNKIVSIIAKYSCSKMNKILLNGNSELSE